MRPRRATVWMRGVESVALSDLLPIRHGQNFFHGLDKDQTLGDRSLWMSLYVYIYIYIHLHLYVTVCSIYLTTFTSMLKRNVGYWTCISSKTDHQRNPKQEHALSMLGSFTTGYWCAAAMIRCNKERQAWCQRNHGWLEHQPGEGFFRTMWTQWSQWSHVHFTRRMKHWTWCEAVKPEVWPNKISHRWSSTLPCRLKGLFSSSMSTRSISMLCLARNTLPDSTLWSSLYFYFSIFQNYVILFIHFIVVLFPFWSSLYFYCYWLLLLVFQLQLHPGWCYWRQGIRGQGQSEHCELCELWNDISWNNFTSMSPAPADAAQERSLERVTQMHLGREKTQSSLGFFSIKKGNSVI